ncbi:UNVERIFIED_CONTAM: hypothetical protein FKN15_035949 [Acipenser sinensis]
MGYHKVNRQLFSNYCLAQLTATTPTLTRERRRQTHAVLRSVCHQQTTFLHIAHSPCRYLRATVSEDNAALGSLQASPQAPGQTTGVAEITFENITQPFTLPIKNITQPFTLPNQNITQPFTLPIKNITQPFTLPNQNITQQFTLPNQNITQPFTLPIKNITQPFTLTIENIT